MPVDAAPRLRGTRSIVDRLLLDPPPYDTAGAQIGIRTHGANRQRLLRPVRIIDIRSRLVVVLDTRTTAVIGASGLVCARHSNLRYRLLSGGLVVLGHLACLDAGLPFCSSGNSEPVQLASRVDYYELVREATV